MSLGFEILVAQFCALLNFEESGIQAGFMNLDQI